MSKELKWVRKKVRQMAEGKAFWAEGKASTDALRPELFGWLEEEQEVSTVTK